MMSRFMQLPPWGEGSFVPTLIFLLKVKCHCPADLPMPPAVLSHRTRHCSYSGAAVAERSRCAAQRRRHLIQPQPCEAGRSFMHSPSCERKGDIKSNRLGYSLSLRLVSILAICTMADG